MTTKLLASLVLATGLSFVACGQKDLHVDTESVVPVCGNDLLERGEICDGADLASESCLSMGFGLGRLACRSDCGGLDVSGCQPLSSCGNDTAEGNEVCDGIDLRDETCVGLSLGAGTLACDATCTAYVTSGCTAAPDCGDDAAQIGETCDGDDLRLESCGSLGFLGGDLGCAGDCQSFDVSLCTCDQDDQCPAFCNADTASCTANDEVCDDLEDNDGDELADCDDLDCFDAVICWPPCPTQDLGADVGDGIVSADTTTGHNRYSPGCDDTSDAPDLQYAWVAPADNRYSFRIFSGFDAVLSLLESACDGAELACVDEAGDWDTEEIVRDLSAGDALVVVVDGFGAAHGQLTLDVNPTEKGLCDDAGDNDGDGLTDCDDHDCDGDPACIHCPDLDLRSDLGVSLLESTTVSLHDDFRPSCDDNSRSADLQAQWQAPVDGTYDIVVSPAGWDPVITVWDGVCGATILACVDNGGDGDAETVVLTLDGGQSITISVDGYGVGEAGDFTLGIAAE